MSLVFTRVGETLTNNLQGKNPDGTVGQVFDIKNYVGMKCHITLSSAGLEHYHTDIGCTQGKTFFTQSFNVAATDISLPSKIVYS